MLKRYFPFIILIAAAGLFIYIKMHQRGPGTTTPKKQPATQMTVPAAEPPSDVQLRDEGIDRTTTHIFYSKHARCRMDCRHIDESEIKEILQKGTINYSKIEEDSRGKTYPFEGVTHDNQRVRVVFAPKPDGLLVVTCIDLNTDFDCDCK